MAKNSSEILLSSFCDLFRGFYRMITVSFYEPKYSEVHTEIAIFVALHDYQLWRAYSTHVWNNYDVLLSIDNCDVSPDAPWRQCPLFVFGRTHLYDLTDPLTPASRAKVFHRLLRVNQLGARYVMVKEIQNFPLVRKIVGNSAVKSGRHEDILKVVMSEVMCGDTDLDTLIAHLERKWPQRVVEYILKRACGLTDAQIESFRDQPHSASSAKRGQMPTKSTTTSPRRLSQKDGTSTEIDGLCSALANLGIG